MMDVKKNQVHNIPKFETFRLLMFTMKVSHFFQSPLQFGAKI